MNPWDKIGVAIGAAIAVIILGTYLGINVSWVPTALGAILPGLFFGAIAAAIAGAITRQLPPALAFGGVTFVITIILRVMFWAETR